MKKLIIMIISIVFLFTATTAIAKDKRKYKKKGGGYERVYEKDHPYHHPKGKAYGHYKKRHGERYRGHRYKRHYTWRQWHKERHQRQEYRDGRYHHDDNGHLMFSFCNWEDGQKVCFSLGID